MIELVKIKYVDNPNKLQSEIKALNKIQFVNKKLHETKNEILLDYIGQFEKVGKLSVGDQIRETHIRFRNITHFEHDINAIDKVYDADDAIFDGSIYKSNTPQFNLVKRSQYGIGCGFKQQVF